MLKLLGSLAFNGANPLTKFFTVLKLLAVLLVVGVICFAVYSTYDAFASKRESKVIIDAQKQEIVRKDGVITDQTKQAENLDAGKKAEDQVIVQLDNTQKKNNQKTADVIQQLEEKVDQIQDNPDFTPEEKSAAVAQVSIDSIWTAYCGTAGSAGSCADPSAPTAPSPPSTAPAPVATS
jgi:hypothetical protein